MKNKFTIILASSSPRRLEILNQNNIEPIVIPSLYEEISPSGFTPSEVVMYLSLQKALWVEDNYKSLQDSYNNPIIISADTLVYKNKILGKPKNKDIALNMLMSLSGKTHEVYTGVSIIKPSTYTRLSFFDVSKVSFEKYSSSDIDNYLNSQEPYDKAGGYGIQGTFKNHIKNFSGDYNNIVGLPFYKLKFYLETLFLNNEL